MIHDWNSLIGEYPLKAFPWQILMTGDSGLPEGQGQAKSVLFNLILDFQKKNPKPRYEISGVLTNLLLGITKYESEVPKSTVICFKIKSEIVTDIYCRSPRIRQHFKRISMDRLQLTRKIELANSTSICTCRGICACSTL